MVWCMHDNDDMGSMTIARERERERERERDLARLGQMDSDNLIIR